MNDFVDTDNRILQIIQETEAHNPSSRRITAGSVLLLFNQGEDFMDFSPSLADAPGRFNPARS